MKFYFKNRVAINIIIKILIIVALLAALYVQVFIRKDISALKSQYLISLKEGDLMLLVVVGLLMIVNWGLEAIKWKWIIQRLEQVSLWYSFKAVFGGVTFSVFTPNRIGEFAGRVFFLKKANKINGVIMTLVGSYSQIVVNVSAGLVAFNFFLFSYKDLDSITNMAAIAGSVTISAGLIFFYFRVDLVHKILTRIKQTKRFEKYTYSLSLFNNRELGTYLMLSFLRYSVYSVQYLFLLMFFGIEIGFILGMIVIAMIFFSQMAFPVPAILELGVRGNLAISFLGMVMVVSVNELSILSASFGLWAVNIIFPALLGALFIMRINFIKKQ